MPVHIEPRGGRYCVVEPDGTEVPKGCYSERSKALARLRAINMHLHKETPLTVYKSADNVWRWIGIFTNNWLDREGQWLSKAAHRRFAEMVETVEYSDKVLGSWLSQIPLFKEIGERGTPDHWLWHVPVPIGYAEDVAFDDRGYLIVAGRQREGEFYSKVYEALSKVPPGELAMSHGMPKDLITFNKDDENVIDEYLSIEITTLPRERAANQATFTGVFAKENAMQIPERKEKWLKEVFGEEIVEQFSVLLDNLDMAAEEIDVPRKENNQMKDKDQAVNLEEEAEVVEEQHEVKAATTEEVGAAESAEEEEVEEDETEETETEEQEVSHGMAMHGEGFQLPVDNREFLDELVKGLSPVLQQVNAKIDDLAKMVDMQQKEIADLKKSDEERITEKAATTPPASMSGWLAEKLGAAVGSDEARIDYNGERTLYNRSKDLEEEPEDANLAHLPPVIRQFIKPGQGRVIPSYPINGQQRE